MEFQLLSLTGVLTCLVYLLAGIVDSVCGGGGLLTIPMLIMLGFPTRYIAGTNQCSVILGCGVSTFEYAKHKKIQYKIALQTSCFAVIGSYFGSYLNTYLPEKAVRLFMLAMIPVIAAIMVIGLRRSDIDRSATLSGADCIARAAILGFIVGAYQGFYGPGAGMFFMMGFAIMFKLDFLKAGGNARLVGFAASIAATVNYAFSGLVFLNVAIAATIFNIAGNYLGARIAVKKGSRIIRPMLFVVVALLLVRIILDYAGVI